MRRDYCLASCFLLTAAVAAVLCSTTVVADPSPKKQPASKPVEARQASPPAKTPAKPGAEQKPAAPKEPAPDTPPTSAQPKPAKRFATVENPSFNRDLPVLFDSGNEEDNSSCMVCHADFEEELISKKHLEATVTCMACHGDSKVHRADEYNIIRPDVIWGRAEQEPFCKQCHPQHMHPEKVDAFHKEWDSKRRPNGRWVTPESVCMDCHGNHAIVRKEGEFK